MKKVPLDEINAEIVEAFVDFMPEGVIGMALFFPQ